MNRLILIICFVLALMGCGWAGVGGSGANFLLIGVGARPLAMGEAYVALADDSSSIYWNPAGLAKMVFPEVLYMYNKWFVDIQHHYLDFAFPSQYGTFGGGYSLLDSGDIQGYDSGGAMTSTFRTSDSCLSLSWGRRISDRFAVGLNLKSISETLENNQASSIAADLGFLFDLNPRFSFGGVLQNVGQPLKFISEETPLPQTYRVGLAFKDKIFGENFIMAADYVNQAGGAASTNFGIEYLLNDLLAFRAGSSKGALRAGVGFKASFFGFDYAYLSHNDLGGAHQISFTFQFGTKDMKKALILESLTLGEAYYKEGKYSEAIVVLRKVLFLDPAHKEARTLFTKANEALKGKAVGKVKGEIEKEREKEINKYIAAGKKLMQKKQYIEAIAEFNKALNINPSHAQALKLIREVQSAFEKKVFRRARKESKKHLGLALNYIFNEEFKKAMAEVEKALKKDPGNVEGLKLKKKLRIILKIQRR